jgi:adenine-specific DNA-methyltransferase
MNNIFKVLEEALLTDERLVAEGKLLKNKAIELALKMDARLLRSLLKNETLSAFFFVDIDAA